ncbi:hypothetical protein [Rhodospirillum sp. A1_3_36]|uniref:hypothetical protein n=1 Tax=Rhodospirillum sp. A1_3_36 TaxID=3391666 RepID=UPI0039A55DAA
MGFFRPFGLSLALSLACAFGGSAWAAVPTPSPHAPAASVTPLSGPVTIGDATVTDAPRLVQSRTQYEQGGNKGEMEIRFSSFVTKTVEGNRVTLTVKGDDFSMDMPGAAKPPEEDIRAMISKVEAKAVIDRAKGATTVSVTGGTGPTAASVEKFAQVLAKGMFGGQTLSQGQEVLSYNTEDLGTGAGTGLTMAVKGHVAGGASGGGRDYVVISGEGPALAQGHQIGAVSFVSYVDRLTGLPAWTHTTLTMDIPDTQNPMKMDMEQTDEVMILE